MKVYLIGHGYAPEFKVTGPNGVAYDEATPFIPANTNTMLSDGVVKAPSASLGFEGVFVPTAYMANGTTLESIFPAANNPEVSLIGYSGNLGLSSGAPQSVYQLDTSQMTEIAGRAAPAGPREHLEAAGQARVDHLRRHRAVGEPRRSPTTRGRSPPSSAASSRSPGCCCRSSSGGGGCSSGRCRGRTASARSSPSAV